MKKYSFLLALLLAALLAACTSDPNMPIADMPPARNYADADVTYSEPIAQYGFRLNMDFTATEFAKYYFESDIADEEREAYHF